MAGYNSIKILRGSSKNLSGNLMSGQPLYIRDKNYLTVGSSDGDVINKAPITVRELVGWSSDNGGIISTNSNGYYVRSNSTSNGLDIFASQPINISAPANINIIASSSPEATTLSNLYLSSSGNMNLFGNGNIDLTANSYINISSCIQSINISSDTDLILTSRTSDVNISAHTNLNASAISLNARANHIALTIGSYPSIHSFANSIALNVSQGAGITLGPQSVVISNANVAFGTILDVDGGVVRANDVAVTSAHLTVSPTQLTINPTGPIDISANNINISTVDENISISSGRDLEASGARIYLATLNSVALSGGWGLWHRTCYSNGVAQYARRIQTTETWPLISNILSSNNSIWTNTSPGINFAIIATPPLTDNHIYLMATFRNGSSYNSGAIERGVLYVWIENNRVSYQSVAGDSGFIANSSGSPVALTQIRRIYLNGLPEATRSFGINGLEFAFDGL